MPLMNVDPIEATVEIAAPPATVWALVSDLRNMARFVGSDPEHKVSLLMDHTRRPGDVADPWYTGDFEATWQDVQEGCTALLEELRG